MMLLGCYFPQQQSIELAGHLVSCSSVSLARICTGHAEDDPDGFQHGPFRHGNLAEKSAKAIEQQKPSAKRRVLFRVQYPCGAWLQSPPSSSDAENYPQTTTPTSQNTYSDHVKVKGCIWVIKGGSNCAYLACCRNRRIEEPQHMLNSAALRSVF